MDPYKSVFYQRYLRLQHVTAEQRMATEQQHKGFGSRLGQMSKVDRAACRRGQIFTKSEAPVMSQEALKTFKKKQDEVAFIRDALRRNYLFKSVRDTVDAAAPLGSVTPLQCIIDCMEPDVVEGGKAIITQGESGDNMCFYVLQSGRATVIVDNEGVLTLEAGGCFGELALIHNAPRAATVRATETCKLFKINFSTFKTIQATSEISKVQAKCEFLKKCNFLDALSSELITKLSGAVEERVFQKGEYIVRQGEWFLDEEALAQGRDVFRGDPALQTKEQEFFIIQDGKVRCTQIKSSGKEVTLVTLEPGQHFGEMALLTDEPRRASCIADTDQVSCLSLSRQNFKLMLGPINVVLEQRMRIRILQSVPILNAISENKLLLMSQAMKIESYRDGTYIIKQGDQGNAFYIIHEGQVRCTTLEDGGKKEVERVRLEPGEFFGERALIKNEVRKANIIAVGDVECLVLTKEQYKEYMDKEVTERVGGRDYMAAGAAAGGAGSNTAVPGSGTTNDPEQLHKPLTSYKFEELHLMRTLGTGTFGRVKLVRPKDSRDSSVYALKCMRKKDVVEKHQDANIISEKNLLFACGAPEGCPFILQLFQTFNTPNTLYMLMEFVQGGELWSFVYDPKRSQVLPRNTLGGLLPEHVKFYVSNILFAFMHMHSRNIAYRDLKPENLLVNSKGYLKVIDFGFAKKIPFFHNGKLQNKTYTLCGTPEYLAPEIVLSHGYDKSVDCWALGCLAYELYYQKTPFAENNDQQAVIFRRIIDSESLLKNPALFPAPVDASFTALVQKMLTYNPSLRLGSTSGGLDDVKSMAFFGPDFAWDDVYSQKAVAPFCPAIKDRLDAQNFEAYAEDESDSPFTGDQTKFHGF